MPVHYIYLALAILTETIGTMALTASQQLTRFWPSMVMLISYVLSLYLMSLALKVMPVGIVYAIWSGLGIVLITVAGFFLFGQRIDLPALLGMGLIIAGVVVIHVFSSASH